MLAGGERSFWSPCTSPHAPGVSPARCFRAWVLSVDSCRVQSGECQMRSGPGGRGLRRRCNRFDQYSILGELFRRWDPHCRNKSETPFQLGYYAQCPHRGTRHGPRCFPARPAVRPAFRPFTALLTYYTPRSRAPGLALAPQPLRARAHREAAWHSAHTAGAAARTRTPHQRTTHTRGGAARPRRRRRRPAQRRQDPSAERAAETPNTTPRGEKGGFFLITKPGVSVDAFLCRRAHRPR